MMRCLFFLSMVLLRIDPAAGQDIDTLRVYFIGNSVTDTVTHGDPRSKAKPGNGTAGKWTRACSHG
jgi:hypothetical protein